MFKNYKITSLSRAALVLVLLINVLIAKIAYINNQDLYWLMLLSIPMLILAIYYSIKKREIIGKDGDMNWKLNVNYNKLQGADIVFPCDSKAKELTVLFGNSHCTQPYLSSIICTETLNCDQDFRSIHAQVNSLKGNKYSQQLPQNVDNANTFTSDVIWRIEPVYFHPELFKINATQTCVKMIEFKLSRDARMENTFAKKFIYSAASSDNQFPEESFRPGIKRNPFSNAESMILFLDSLRQLSGKKPVGIRLSITDKKEFHKMCFAFRKAEIVPDYLVIEDLFNNQPSFNSYQNFGMPLYEALLFVSKTLESYGLNKEIKIIAGAEIHTAFDVLKLHALGADAISMQNHLTRSDRYYETDGVQLTNFSQQCMAQLRSEILDSTMNLMQGLGYINIKDITLPAFFRKLDALYSKELSNLYDELPNNSEKKSLSILKKDYHKKEINTKLFFN